MSDEDAELQARIKALTGQINEHKRSQLSHSPAALPPSHFYSSQPSRGAYRWSPYGHPGRGGHKATHKNRTLVLNGSRKAQQPESVGGLISTTMADTVQATLSPTTVPPIVDAPSDAFVSTRRAGANQLMTKNTFEREQKHMMDYPEPTKLKPQPPDNSVPAKPLTLPDKTTAHSSRNLEINGIKFQMLHDGSKLIRLPDNAQITKATPKTVKIANVDFFRTKHGNLVRATTVKGSKRPIKTASKPQCEHFTKQGTFYPFQMHGGHARIRESSCSACAMSVLSHCRHQLIRFAGSCPFGPACRFAHDPTKVAICKDFLRTGACPAGKNCDMSHEPTYHRVSACTHFLRGNCTNDACRFPHVRVSPSALVCRPFASLGFCSKGSNCDKRHVHECPDYSNHGRCTGHEQGKCSLPHIDRASTLRKAAERQAKSGTGDESDVTSDEDDKESGYDSDEIDSDIDIFTSSGGHGQDVAEQKDFISFA